MTATDTPVRRTELVNQLFGVVWRFRRQVGRRAGRVFDRPDIGTTQAEFLRLVSRHPGISVKEAAGRLGLAANSVSTVVTSLVKDDLLLREPDPGDRRVMRLRLPADAQALADATRRQRHTLVSEALDALHPDERADLERGLAVLAKLTDSLARHAEQEVDT